MQHYYTKACILIIMSLEMFTTSDISTAICRSCNKNEQIRLQVLLLVKNGMSPAKVAKEFSVHRSTVHRWIKRAEKEGLSSLKCKPGRGVKSFLTTEQIFELKKHYQSQYQQMTAIIVVGKQRMQFNFSERNLKYLIQNQE